jgi:hypothetical protein
MNIDIYNDEGINEELLNDYEIQQINKDNLWLKYLQNGRHQVALAVARKNRPGKQDKYLPVSNKQRRIVNG